jgi:hypothetical protein
MPKLIAAGWLFAEVFCFMSAVSSLLIGMPDQALGWGLLFLGLRTDAPVIGVQVNK